MNYSTIKVVKKNRPHLTEPCSKKGPEKISIDEKRKLLNLFFYLQDVSQEIQSAFGIMQIVESTLDPTIPKESVTFTEFKNTYTVHILNGNPQIIKTMAKVALQTTIINICRISEAVNNPEIKMLFAKYCPISYKRLDVFIEKRYTSHVKQYRNKYAAHPINRTTDEFLSLKEIFSLMEKILKIKTMKDLKFKDIFSFISTLHHPDVKDPDISITWAIHAISIELQKNGIDVDREKPY